MPAKLCAAVRRSARTATFTAAMAAMPLLTATAAELGDADKGFAYAKANCAGCHAILTEDKRSPVPAATPFRTFANVPGVNRRAMTVFLQTPHPTMPNLVVKGDDADNVIAFILSLKDTK